MALYIPHSIFHLAQLLYVRPETFGPYYVHDDDDNIKHYFTSHVLSSHYEMHMNLLLYSCKLCSFTLYKVVRSTRLTV